MEKFRDKYRIDTTRLPIWNYGWEAAYFITICTNNRIPFFGEIIDGSSYLSNIGMIALDEWKKTPVIRSDMNIILGEFMIMPDHFHAIIYIGHNEFNQGFNRGTKHGASTNNTFGPQRKNLASIIRGFKSAVTISARKIRPDFAWQARYHDHIIRNEESYHRISQYIKDNPKNWKGNIDMP